VAATFVTVALARQFPYLPGLVMLIVVGAIGLAAVLYAVLGGPPRAR
jgi:hypothetical protein